MNNRVVISGAGVVSPIGSGFTEFLDSISNSVKGINRIKNFNASLFPTDLGAEAKKDNQVILTPPEIDRKDLFIHDAMEQLFNSNPEIEQYTPENRILSMGTGIDYFDIVNFVNQNSVQDEFQGWKSYSMPSCKVAERLSEKYKIYGGINTNVAACVASTQAMGLAYRMLKKKTNIALITGGYDSMLCHLHYMGFYKLGALSQWEGMPDEACRPFDKHRKGLVLGEGAIAYFMQNEAEANKDTILAEIAGYSSTMDAYMVTDPLPEGTFLAQAALNAIKDAGLVPNDIDCVHLHGTGTYKNALSEAAAMKVIFGDRSAEVPVFSLKGQIGHLIGACGAMEILGVIWSLKEQKVPVTVNFNTPDPEVPLYVITGNPLSMKIKNVLKLNAAFGGQNTAFVIKKYE